MQFTKNTGKISQGKQKQGKTEHVTKKIWTTGSAEQRHESGRLKHARTEDNVTIVDELVALLNHEGQKQTHSITPRYPQRRV